MRSDFNNLRIALSATTLAAVPLIAGIIPDRSEKPKPNVIFILLDDFGYMDLSCYGSKFYETPNIDRLARQGIRFSEAYAACPVSSPTRACIMTGKYPVNTGITDWIPGRQATNSGSAADKFIAQPFTLQLDPEEVTIAEVLKESGYKTMISGKWHLGADPRYWPEHHGFEINKGGHSAGQPNKSDKSNGYFSPYGNPRLEDGPEGEYLTDRQTDEAIKFIEASKGDPFFLYLSFYAVHNPLQGKDKLVEKFTLKADSMGLYGKQAFTREKEWIRDDMSNNYKERVIQSNPVYAAMIYSVDENIGRLLRKLEDLNLDENTMIIFTSDNGGLSTSEGSPTCNYPLRAGKGWLYEGGIRVPLIMRIPGMKIRHPEIATPVSSVDFFSTIVDFTDTEKSLAETDGVSLLPLIKKGRMKERPLFWHYPHYSNQGVEPGSAVRLGKYKLIDNFEKGRQELYNLENDLSETNDISSYNYEKTEELFNLLKEWRTTTNAKMMVPNPKWNGKF